MQTKQDTPKNAPVELTQEELQSVAGGLPRGGWGQEGNVAVGGDAAVSDVASALVEPTPLPRGGW